MQIRCVTIVPKVIVAVCFKVKASCDVSEGEDHMGTQVGVDIFREKSSDACSVLGVSTVVAEHYWSLCCCFFCEESKGYEQEGGEVQKEP